MTVKELLEKLKEYEAEKEIRVAYYSQGNYNITDVDIIEVYPEVDMDDNETDSVILDFGDF